MAPQSRKWPHCRPLLRDGKRQDSSAFTDLDSPACYPTQLPPRKDSWDRGSGRQPRQGRQMNPVNMRHGQLPVDTRHCVHCDHCTM